MEKEKIVVIGGGFAGLNLCKHLDRETFGIKTVAEAAHTRDEILDRFERGALCKDPEKRLRLLLRPTKYPLRRHWGD